jgi:hypothetical protein
VFHRGKANANFNSIQLKIQKRPWEDVSPNICTPEDVKVSLSSQNEKPGSGPSAHSPVSLERL